MKKKKNDKKLPRWAQRLIASRGDTHTPSTSDLIDTEDDLAACMDNLDREEEDYDTTLREVKRFYSKTDDLAHIHWSVLAAKECLQQKSNYIWESNTIQVLWNLLVKYGETTANTTTVDYAAFKKVRAELIKQCSNGNCLVEEEPFLTDTSFFRVLNHSAIKTLNGTIATAQYYSYLIKKVHLYQTRVELGSHGTQEDGYITEVEMEQFFKELIPTMPQLRLPQSFIQFYICGAVRKFFFFLDHARKGRILIDSVMQSAVMMELIQFQTNSDEETNSHNWFAGKVAASFYDHYVKLDKNRNGMLSVAEMYHYQGGNYTKMFIDRIFQVTSMYNGEMDYKKYIDFVLATENLSSKPTLDLFFRVLDVNEDGYLTPMSVLTFYKQIEAKYEEKNLNKLDSMGVITEIFDIVNPKRAFTIYKSDLARCKMRGTVLSMLVDYKAFYAYDNRESLNSQQKPMQFQTLCEEIEKAFECSDIPMRAPKV